MENNFNKLQENIKFNKEDIHSKDKIEKPIMVIADSIEVYLITDNAPPNRYGIAFINESCHCDRPTIFVDKYFLKLDYYTQLYTIYHELGHYVNKDLERIKSKKEKFYSFIERVIKKGLPLDEQRADLYAYKKLLEHFPEGVNEISHKILINHIFYDISRNCIQVIIDNGFEGKLLNKYTKQIRKEFNIRKQLLRKNMEHGSVSFYDPKK